MLAAVTAITGEPGAGKSTLATALAGHVACGATFLGRSVTQRRVLLLDRENPLPVVQERTRRLRIQDGSHFKVWGSWLPNEAPDPGSNAILRWVVNTSPKPLVIIDSFRAFLYGDENDASVVREFMQQSRRLADAGAGVILLHHPGKGESAREYRGSSDFKACLDIGYLLANLGEQHLGRLRLKAFKARFAVDLDSIIHYSDGEFVADERMNAVSKTVTEQLAELLRQNPGIRTAEFEALADKRGLGRNRGRQFLEDGIKVGEIRRERGPRNTLRHFLIDTEDAGQ